MRSKLNVIKRIIIMKKTSMITMKMLKLIYCIKIEMLKLKEELPEDYQELTLILCKKYKKVKIYLYNKVVKK